MPALFRSDFIPKKSRRKNVKWAVSPLKTRKPVWIHDRAPIGFGQYSAPDYFDTLWASVFVAGCEAIGANPYDVAGLLLNESGFNPSATNSIRCVGLNQMCPGSQNFLSDMSVDQYTSRGVAEQLPYVFAFWQNWLAQYNLITISAAELYWLNFLPATFVPYSPPWHVISQQGDPYYSSNQSLDVTGDGQITLWDLQLAIWNAESNNASEYAYLAEMITLAGGPVAALPWPWLFLGTAVAGYFGYHAIKRWAPWIPIG